MKTVVHLAITPDADAKLTPLELLEDFADASRGWQYLDEASVHYAEAKHRPACILRHQRPDTPQYVDLAFAATNPADHQDIELVILDPADPNQALTLDQRNTVIEAFIHHFRQYLGGRPGHASLRVEKDNVNRAKAAKT